MNAKPNEITAPPGSMADKTNQAIGAIQPMLNQNGEFDLAGMQIGLRIAQFQAFAQQANANMVLLESTILSQMPEGTTLVPIPVIPGTLDAWDGAKVQGLKMQTGHVEPSADFIIKLGNMLDVRLTEVFAGVTNDTGTAMYAIRYNASLMLPNGELLSCQNEGKDQELYNSGGKQAHIVENTRKKAKRNAIKALLGLPTTMPKEDFFRPWLLFRPVFRAGNAESDRILALKDSEAQEAKRLLFSKTAIEVKPNEVDPDMLRGMIEAATTDEEMEGIRKRLHAAALTGDQRAELGTLFKQRKAQIQKAPTPEPTPTPPAATTTEPAPTPSQAPADNGGF